MSKLSRLVFVAALSAGLLTTAAEAATARPKAPPPPNSGPTVCVAACNLDKLIIITTPPPPQDCAPGPVRQLRQITTKQPRVTCGHDTAYQACGDKLQHLRRVTVGQINRIDDRDVVHLVPLCDIVHRSLTQQELSYLARGNVQGLIPAIGHNDTLMAGLEDAGYRANDVIGVAMAPHAAILYVSRR